MRLNRSPAQTTGSVGLDFPVGFKYLAVRLQVSPVPQNNPGNVLTVKSSLALISWNEALPTNFLGISRSKLFGSENAELTVKRFYYLFLPERRDLMLKPQEMFRIVFTMLY